MRTTPIPSGSLRDSSSIYDSSSSLQEKIDSAIDKDALLHDLGCTPKLLNSRTLNVMLEAIKIGMPQCRAADLAGISPQTVSNYKTTGRKLYEVQQSLAKKKRDKWFNSLSNYNRLCVIFFLELKEAEAVFLNNNIKLIHEAAKGGRKITERKRTYKEKLIPVRDQQGNETGQYIKHRILVEDVISEKTANPLWTASAWLLERRCREEFSKNAYPTDSTIEDVAGQVGELINE